MRNEWIDGTQQIDIWTVETKDGKKQENQGDDVDQPAPTPSLTPVPPWLYLLSHESGSL